jgi:hypothetical protein
MKKRKMRLRLYLPLLLALLLSFPVAAQDNTVHRLVTKYEVKGDRVRYYSSEREDWEELPNSLVDWTATNKDEKERATAASSPEAVQLDKELEHEAEAAEAALPLVAPGLRLPEPTGVFLLDNFQGEPQIVEIQQSAGDINRNTKTNIFRGAANPIAGLKVTIELEGAHAKIQCHVEVPSLYIRPEDNEPEQAAQPHLEADTTRPSQKPQQPQQPQQPEGPIVPFDRFRIVKVEVKGNKRIVGDVKRQVTGKVSQEEHWVKTTITGVTGGWLKLTPTESLAAGEYALVEMLGKEGMNLYLWDFGVNPKAPANANPWKAEQKPAPPQSKANQ